MLLSESEEPRGQLRGREAVDVSRREPVHQTCQIGVYSHSETNILLTGIPYKGPRPQRAGGFRGDAYSRSLIKEISEVLLAGWGI